MLSRSSSLSNSANAEVKDHAEMDAGGFQVPRVHGFENVEMV